MVTYAFLILFIIWIGSQIYFDIDRRRIFKSIEKSTKRLENLKVNELVKILNEKEYYRRAFSGINKVKQRYPL